MVAAARLLRGEPYALSTARARIRPEGWIPPWIIASRSRLRSCCGKSELLHSVRVPRLRKRRLRRGTRCCSSARDDAICRDRPSLRDRRLCHPSDVAAGRHRAVTVLIVSAEVGFPQVFRVTFDQPLLADCISSLDGRYTHDTGYSSAPLYSPCRPIAAVRDSRKPPFIQSPTPPPPSERLGLASG